MMLNKKRFDPDILSFLIKKLRDAFLGKNFRVVLFGSRVRGDYTEQSDYDLAFDIEGISSSDWAAFAVEVREAIPTLHQVDLIWLQHCSKDFLERIKKEGQVIYESKN